VASRSLHVIGFFQKSSSFFFLSLDFLKKQR